MSEPIEILTGPDWVINLAARLNRDLPNLLSNAISGGRVLHAVYGSDAEPLFAGMQSTYNSWSAEPQGIAMLEGTRDINRVVLAGETLALVERFDSFALSTSGNSPTAKNATSLPVPTVNPWEILEVAGVDKEAFITLASSMVPFTTPRAVHLLPRSELLDPVADKIVALHGLRRDTSLPLMLFYDGFTTTAPAYPNSSVFAICGSMSTNQVLIPIEYPGVPLSYFLNGFWSNPKLKYVYDPRYGSSEELVAAGMSGVVQLFSKNSSLEYATPEVLALYTEEEIPLLQGTATTFTLGGSFPGLAITKKCLPIFGVPAVKDYTLLGTGSSSERYSYETVDGTVTFIRHASPFLAEYMAVDKAWYEQYILTGWGALAPLTDEKATTAIAKWPEGLTSDLTVVRYPYAIPVPKNVISLTDIYKEYAKAMDKACLTNDFYEQIFSGEMTWGAARNAIGLKPLGWSTFFGIRQANELLIASPAVERDTREIVTRNGTAPEPAFVFTVEGVDITMEDALDAYGRNATMTTSSQNTVLSQAGTVLGYSAEQVNAVKESRTALVNAQKALVAYVGTGRDVYSFAGDAISTSGFVDYARMPVQAAYKGAIASAALYDKVGTSVVAIVDEFAMLLRAEG